MVVFYKRLSPIKCCLLFCCVNCAIKCLRMFPYCLLLSKPLYKPTITDRQKGRWTEKASYRGTSLRSAPKKFCNVSVLSRNLSRPQVLTNKWPPIRYKRGVYSSQVPLTLTSQFLGKSCISHFVPTSHPHHLPPNHSCAHFWINKVTYGS